VCGGGGGVTEPAHTRETPMTRLRAAAVRCSTRACVCVCECEGERTRSND